MIEPVKNKIGFGTAPLGNMFRDIPEEEALATVEAAWDEWISLFDQARKSAFAVLSQLQEEGVIKGWGLGVNTTEPIELALDMEEAAPTISLSATQYTLLKHERALQRMMPKAQEQGAKIVVGGPFNSGALLGGDHFDYAEIPPHIKERVASLTEIAQRHEVSLKDAAVQFSAAHPAVAAVIPGSSRPDRIKP